MRLLLLAFQLTASRAGSITSNRRYAVLHRQPIDTIPSFKEAWLLRAVLARVNASILRPCSVQFAVLKAPVQALTSRMWTLQLALLAVGILSEMSLSACLKMVADDVRRRILTGISTKTSASSPRRLQVSGILKQALSRNDAVEKAALGQRSAEFIPLQRDHNGQISNPKK